MIFSYDKCCVCPRDIEVYLSAVFLCLAAALPHHTTKILQEHIPHLYFPFLDNIGVKGSKIRYDDIRILPNIRRFILEHIQKLNTILTNLKRTDATVFRNKSQFYMTGIKVIGYIYNFKGRYPNVSKIAKILEWPPLSNIITARAFIGVYMYFKIW